MTLIAWQNGRPVIKNGLVATEQACCCEQCTVDVTQVFGGENSGGISTVVQFPSSPQCVQIVFSMPDCVASASINAFHPSVTLFNDSVSDGTTLCLFKPDGAENIGVSLFNIFPANCTISIRVKCSTCDCNEFP